MMPYMYYAFIILFIACQGLRARGQTVECELCTSYRFSQQDPFIDYVTEETGVLAGDVACFNETYDNYEIRECPTPLCGRLEIYFQFTLPPDNVVVSAYQISRTCLDAIKDFISPGQCIDMYSLPSVYSTAFAANQGTFSGWGLESEILTGELCACDGERCNHAAEMDGWIAELQRASEDLTTAAGVTTEAANSASWGLTPPGALIIAVLLYLIYGLIFV